MNRRPLLASTAAVAAFALCTAAGTASASASSTAVAAGTASSGLSLLHLTVGGHDLRIADLNLVSDTVSTPTVSSVTITPITADGTAYGQQSITPATSPKGIAAMSSPSALASFASLASPAISVSASSAPSSQAGATSLGSIKVLGMPVSLAGALNAGSSVSGTAGSLGEKTVTLKNLALPGVGDLLKALGLDLSKVPTATLSSLVSKLGLVTGAITTAQNAVGAAQAAVNSAAGDVAAKTAAVTSATSALTGATAALGTATSTLQTHLNGITGPLLAANPGANTIAGYGALVSASSPVVAAIDALVPNTLSSYNTYVSALNAQTVAQTALTVANTALSVAQGVLSTLNATLSSALSTLTGALTGKLDSTPLVSLGSLEVSTKSVVTSATAGGQTAQVVGGTVTGLKVLGTDVIQKALGASTLDLGAATSAVAGQVNSAIAGLTGTLSSVLSSVAKLSIPAPQIDLLTKTTMTGISGGFGQASTAVQALTVTLPSISVPSALAVPGASSLPALAGVVQSAGALMSSPLSIGLLNLHDQASFAPAVINGVPVTSSGGHTTTTGGLPNTGLPVGLVALSVVVLAGGLVVRRRLATIG